MAGHSGVHRRAMYVPPMAGDVCNTRRTVTSGIGERPREHRGQEGDPTSHCPERVVGTPGSWVRLGQSACGIAAVLSITSADN